jgi:putative ABC transport system substrate-binding protein
MDRRTFLAGTGAVLVAAPLAAEAQQAGKVYRVGILGEKASDPSEARLWQAFRLGLRDLGWIEGKNILFEDRWGDGNSLLAVAPSVWPPSPT